MSLEQIDPVEKISIIFKLVKHFFYKTSVEFNIKLSVNLANNLHNLGDIINKDINSEYLEQLNKLLRIIKNYYPKILNDLNKSDINNSNNCFILDNNINKIKHPNSINIIECTNEYNEINYIMQYIQENNNKAITIISNNKKILNLLNIRLDLKQIKYNNYAQYIKNYHKISQLFKNKIAYYFNDISSKDLIKITKLLSFLDKSTNNNSRITICDLQNINIINTGDIVFCLSMNNETWQLFHDAYALFYDAYALQSTISIKYSIDNVFEYILQNSKDLYCLYSSIVNGKSAIKSSILNKLEVNKKYILLQNNYNLSLNNNQNWQNNNIKPPEINNNLLVLNSSDIRNLLYDPNKFYYNHIIGLQKEIEHKKDSIYTLFKDIFYRYFNKNYNKTYNDILKITEKLDSLYLKKFQQIINYLDKNNIKNNSHLILNNELLETNINNNLIIKTHCDRIEINNNTINIKKYCLNKLMNKSSILNGKETNLITQALILNNNKIIDENSEINFEIISPDWNNNIPIIINKFKISINNIKSYLENILNTIKNYNQINITLDNNVINL